MQTVDFLLAVFQPTVGCLLAICWLLAGHLSVNHWLFVVHLSAHCWPFAVHLLAECWLFVGHLSADCWLFAVHLSADCWKFAGQLVTMGAIDHNNQTVTYQSWTVCQSVKMPPVHWAPHSIKRPTKLQAKQKILTTKGMLNFIILQNTEPQAEMCQVTQVKGLIKVSQ